MLHRLGEAQGDVEIYPCHEDHEVEAPSPEEVQGRVLRIRAGYPRDRIEIELEVLAVNLLGEHPVRFHDEGIVEAAHEEHLAHPEAHEIVVDVAFAPLLVVGGHKFVEIHISMITYLQKERKRRLFP